MLIRTQAAHAPIEPVAFDCVKFIVIRAGSARLFSDHVSRHVAVGDVIVLAPNTLCGTEPEGRVTMTTLYLDRDYVIDQVFWQHAAQFTNRFEASDFLEAQYPEPIQVARIGEHRAELLIPWLDELAAMSQDGARSERFYRAQSLLFAIMDIVLPHVSMTGQQTTQSQYGTAIPTTPRHRPFQSLRDEARTAAEMLRGNLSRRWSVSELADAVHLSPSQLRRVFVTAYGKSPIAFLTMLRVKQIAHLLRNTESPISSITSMAGWDDPDFAARQFRNSLGVSPSEYRRSTRNGNSPPDPERTRDFTR